jgi:DNA-binding PadR family transcriptional regulator
MSLDHILLGMLREPASGYDLRQQFDEGPRHFWAAELSQIYPALQAMEKRGWLKSRREPSPQGPARRVYQRTATGTKALRNWLQSEPILGTERFAYLAQLIFHGELGRLEQTLRFLTQLRAKLAAFAQFLEQVEADTKGTASARMNNCDFHDLMCVRFGVRSLQAKVAACDECIAMVRARLRSDGRAAVRRTTPSGV